MQKLLTPAVLDGSVCAGILVKLLGYEYNAEMERIVMANDTKKYWGRKQVV